MMTMKKKTPSLLFEESRPGRRGFLPPTTNLPETGEELIPPGLRRRAPLRLPELSEMEVSRHFTSLAERNFGVDQGFYPLGSCTMKYNPKLLEDLAELPGFKGLHPLQGEETVQGALALCYYAERVFAALTGMDEYTLQPAAGAHGEQTGLFIIKAALRERGEKERNVILVPDTAHGTNPASATRTGFTVRTVPSSPEGIIEPAALEPHLGPKLAGMMLTNPNTLGLFEDRILEITALIHRHGGLVYYDGANLNAILGHARPGDMGFDLVHLNLHKTFATPHGGGGPGAGPLGVKAHLGKYLPVPRIISTQDGYNWSYDFPSTIGKVKGFWGHFSVVVKALAYILSLGGEGLQQAAEDAVLAANYLQKQLKEDFNLPYDRPCMHEFVLGGVKKPASGIRSLDLAKRILDYGIHPPTMYFPLVVAEALMIEPTESVTLELLDYFGQVMQEIAGQAREESNKLKAAPHSTPVRRPDEARAARNPVLKWRADSSVDPE